MKFGKIGKIIFLGLGVTLLVSFGSFSKAYSRTKEMSLKELRSSVVADPKDHTMGKSLFNYMDPKVHHLIKEKEFKNIWIVGDSDRSGEASKYEKRDKLFNWQRPTAVIQGEHYTIPSVMNETKEWLKNNKNYAFIDNEIGFMAKAAQSEAIQFSYLHIISDNLYGGFQEDLTNERGKAAKEHRTKILQKAKTLIEESLVKKEESLRAAIDFGSGSIKIQTALIDPSGQKVVGEPLMLKYVPLSLSEDVALHEGRISIEMQQKAKEILTQFKEEALEAAASKGYPNVAFSGIATAVFRKAENGQDLLQNIEKDLGIHFQILSQEEEGKLGFSNARILYPEIAEEDLLVWDSGNGSFQITEKMGNTYKIYQGPLGHGTVRVLLSKEIRGGKVLESHISGNPVQMDEAPQLAQGIESLLPAIPSWLQDKLNSKKTVIATFGDGESIFALVSRALEKSNGDTITQTEVKKVLGMSLGQDDDFFDSRGLHRKTGTSALLVSSIMEHFNMQAIHYKTAVGNTSGILVLPDFWQKDCVEVPMEERPDFLYKVLSMDDWAESREIVHLSSMDNAFIHLSTEEQLDKIIEKYWAGASQYVVLKIETAKLSGKLVLEANPGGTNKYYHLYNGTIPLSTIAESKVETTLNEV